MPDRVVVSARFEGDANSLGSFGPPRQTFTVPEDVSSAIVRIRIDSSHPGIEHETRIYVNSPDIGFINYGQPDAREGEDIIASMFNVGRFTAWILSDQPRQISYELGIYFFGFQPGEHVVVTLDLLALNTNLDEVTRDILIAAEADEAVKAVTFGLSDATIATIVGDGFTAPEFAIGPTPHLTMQVSVYNSDSLPPGPGFPMRTEVAIDVETEQVVVTGTLVLDVYVTAGDEVRFVATAYAGIEIRCVPAMVTTTRDTLQLQVRSVRLISGLFTLTILDEGEILAGYPVLDDFRSDIETIVNSIVQRQGPFGGLLPAYLASRPMPDYWNRAANMELTFERFNYGRVETHGVDVGYLFAVFSVRSLMLPSPCYCEEELALQTQGLVLPVSPDKFTLPPSSDPIRSRIKYRRFTVIPPRVLTIATVDEVKATVDVWPPPAYEPIFAAAELMAFGVSQRAFREIARPYANQGDDQSFSTGGAVYASARFWYRSALQDATITSDGVSAIIDFTTEGSAKAAVRDRCGDDVASASVRLRIRIDDTSVRWVIGIEQQQTEPYTLTITALPSVLIGNITAEFDSSGDPPPPIDQVDEWVLSSIANGLRPSLNRIAEAKIAFVRTENFVNGDLKIQFAEDYYLPGQALVLAARLDARGG